MSDIKTTLETLTSFILEALIALSDSPEFDFNIQNYDTNNIASVGVAQEKQAIVAQHLESLSQKIIKQHTFFKELEITVENLFNQFHTQFLIETPRDRGYPQDLYFHKVKTSFAIQEGYDLDELRKIALRFSGLKDQLEARGKRIEKVYWQLKALQDKNKEILQSRPNVPWVPSDAAENFTPNQTQMPKAMTPLNPSVPPPAINHPKIPEFLKL